jgi:glycosyltransferase involved in cell wall biosynthesis/O-antigen/teichoic acid export membrane protein
MQLSIIIPAQNEAARLPDVLRAYARHFCQILGNDFEIIVVANHCEDDTAVVARTIALDFHQIGVLDEPNRVGKGGAVILGAKAATGDWVGFVDADGATPPAEFARLFGIAQRADGVIASRWLPGANVTVHQKGLRLLSSRIFNLTIRLLLGLRYRDTQCGAKIFKAEAWQQILPHIGITRFAFDVDLLFQLKRHNFHITEEPTTWHDVAGSKVNVLSSSLEMFLAILRMRLLYSPLKPLVRLYDHTIAKPVEFLLADPLFRHTFMLSAAAMAVNLCNIAFQMLVGRALPHAEYTLLATFLAIFAIAARPFGTLSTAMNHYTSILIQEGRQVLIGRLVIKWGLRTALPSIAIALAGVFLAPHIAGFFHLERIAPVIVAALAIPVIFCFPVFDGALAGMQRFGMSAIASSIGAIVRVMLGAFLVYAIHPASGWALLGHVGGMYTPFIILVMFLFPYFARQYRTANGTLPSFRSYLFWSFLVQLGIAVLMTGDVILVRRYLPHEEEFAYAATLGRMVIFLSGTVAAALFPKVATGGAFTAEHRSLYLRSLLYTSSFVAISLVLCFGFPGWMLRLLFGFASPSQHLVRLTRWMGLIMAISSLLQLNAHLLLAQRRFRLLSITILSAIAYIVGIHYMGSTIGAIMIIAASTNLLAFIATTVGILRPDPGLMGLTKR